MIPPMNVLWTNAVHGHSSPDSFTSNVFHCTHVNNFAPIAHFLKFGTKSTRYEYRFVNFFHVRFSDYSYSRMNPVRSRLVFTSLFFFLFLNFLLMTLKSANKFRNGRNAICEMTKVERKKKCNSKTCYYFTYTHGNTKESKKARQEISNVRVGGTIRK